MLVGLNAQSTDYPSHFSAFPKTALCRVFGGVGSGIPPWSGDKLSVLPMSIIPHVSFKDWQDDCAAVKRWLDQMPPSSVLRQVWLTYQHEPEGDMTPQEYRRRWAVLAAAVAAHPNAARVILVPIQTLQWTVNTAADKGQGDPFTWWAGVGHAAGMDCYVDSWASAYPDPARFIAPAVRLAAGVGRPLVVPELGVIRLKGDESGVRRAAWIRAVCQALRLAGCEAVSWWCAPGANDRDFHLSDAPSAQAWADVTVGRY